MHVTFSFASSSRHAKTRTSNYRKVVRQQTEGVVGSNICILLEFYFCLIPVVKEFWKSVKNWQSYRHEFGLLFLGTQCITVLVEYESSTVEITRSSAVAERPRDASCRWIFCCHSRSLKVIRNDTIE